jgi:hypothetical protein
MYQWKQDEAKSSIENGNAQKSQMEVEEEEDTEHEYTMNTCNHSRLSIFIKMSWYDLIMHTFNG